MASCVLLNRGVCLAVKWGIWNECGKVCWI